MTNQTNNSNGVIAPLNDAQTKAQMAIADYNPWYIKRIISLDIFLNGFVFGGVLGETISSRTGRAAMRGEKWAIALAWVLGKFRKNHCALAVADTVEQAKQTTYLANNSGVIAPQP